MKKAIPYLVAGFVIVLSGCGASNPEPVAISQPAPPVEPQPAPARSFKDICEQDKKGALRNISGTEICETISKISIPGSAPYTIFGNFGQNYTQMKASVSGTSFPILNPNDSSQLNSIYSYDSGVSIQSGDQVRYEGSGSWGASGQHKTYGWGSLFVSFTFSSGWSCADFTMSGADTKGDTQSWQNIPMGFYVSAGNEFILLNPNTTVTFNQNGNLRMGFNVPINAYSYYCANFDYRLFERYHCETSNGTTVSCGR